MPFHCYAVHAVAGSLLLSHGGPAAARRISAAAPAQLAAGAIKWHKILAGAAAAVGRTTGGLVSGAVAALLASLGGQATLPVCGAEYKVGVCALVADDNAQQQLAGFVQAPEPLCATGERKAGAGSEP